VIEAAVALRGKGKSNPKTARDMDVAGRIFLDLVGDRRMNDLSWQDAAAFRDAAIALPKAHGKGAFKGLTPSRAVELADAIDMGDAAAAAKILGPAKAASALELAPVLRTGKKTLNKHLSSLKWAAKTWFEKNRGPRQARDWTPFNGEFFSKTEVRADVRVVRAALSDEELRTLFTSTLFTGHSGDRLRATPGQIVIRDGRFWAPLISLHSAARMDEILQLRPQDVELFQDTRVFAFGRSAEVVVKNEYSRRRVPIHPALIGLGLLDHAAEMRRRGETQLFPELERGGPDGRFAYEFTKWFTEFRKAIGFYEPGRDFHALRHTASTALFNGGVDTSLVAAIMGHAQQGVTAGVYLSGYKLAGQAAAIAKLDFGVERLVAARPGTATDRGG
jgi:integrase